MKQYTSTDVKIAHANLERRYLELMQEKLESFNLADVQCNAQNFAQISFFAIESLKKVVTSLEKHEKNALIVNKADLYGIVQEWKKNIAWLETDKNLKK